MWKPNELKPHIPRSNAYDRLTTGRARLCTRAARQSQAAMSEGLSRTVSRSSNTNGLSNAFW
jgi:hypothetical protein